MTIAANTGVSATPATETFGYIGLFNGKRVEFYAASLYAAKVEAIRLLKPKKREENLVSVMLAEKNGKEVVHTADF